jgi:cytidylate kinase
LLLLFSFLLGIVQPVTSKRVARHVLWLEAQPKKKTLQTVSVVERCNRLDFYDMQRHEEKLQKAADGGVISQTPETSTVHLNPLTVLESDVRSTSN